jgi:hypothetical protein
LKKITFSKIRLDRVEDIYLTILRVAVLAVATICLCAAVYFAGDAAWRFAVSTKVETTPTTVSGVEVATKMRDTPDEERTADGPAIPAHVRTRHQVFVKEVFPAYYAIYRQASEAYKKPEDKTLTSDELLGALGYDLGSYAAGEDPTTRLFVEDVTYRVQIKAAVTAALAGSDAVRLLREYKVAEKTAQSCSTAYERRRVWDSYSTACRGWYYEPYGCEVTRSVPVERCVPAYPDGIVSPAVAFGRADEAFRNLWLEKFDKNAAEAAKTIADREATRAQIGPKLLTALQIALGFLVVMFFFLIVAIERHLRRLSAMRSKETERETPAA